MQRSGAASTAQAHRHCALCPSAAFAELAALPDLSQLQVHPVTAQPSVAADAPDRPPPQPAPNLPVPPLSLATAAEALFIFWSQAPALEAALAAVPGVIFFDWQGDEYRERQAARPIPAAPDPLLERTNPPVYSVPAAMRLQFQSLRSPVECMLGEPQPLAQALRLPAVRSVRASGGYRIGQAAPAGTPPRGVSFSRSSGPLTPAGGTPADPQLPAGAQVGLRAVPLPDEDRAAAAASRGLVLPMTGGAELLNWIGTTPPIRWRGLLFALLPDGIWIDSLAQPDAVLPPFLQAERFHPHTGSVGSTLWLQSGTGWSPPLMSDLILERLQAVPHCDYLLWPDLGGTLRCRYILDRSRLRPLDRATVRLQLAAGRRRS